MIERDDDEPRRRRWGTWIALALVGFFLLVFLGHAFWGWYQERELDREVAQLRAAGEPMVAGDFKHEQVSEAQNAVPLLRRAADSIDDQVEAWKRVEQLEVGDLLKDENVDMVRGIVEKNATALALLKAARGKNAVDWQIPLRSPMVSTLLPDLAKQKNLAKLTWMSALLAHQAGDDREAMERIGDLLLMGRAMAQMDLGAMPNLVSYFIFSMAAGAAMEIVADLRVGEGKGEVAPEKVRMVMARLLDEEGSKQRAVRVMQFERAMGVEWITTKEAIWGGALPSDQMQKAGFALRRYVMRPAIFSDGRFLLRYAKANQEAMEASGNWPEYQRQVQKPKALLQTVESSANWHAMALMAAANYERMTLQRYRASTLRRLAGAGLGVRIYQEEHRGELPRTLEDLTPVYLREAPRDPMSESGTIRYDAARGILWSVGENGSDGKGSNQVVKEGEGRWGREDVVVHLKKGREK